MIKGHFDHSREILLGPVTRQGKLCYMVITPFIRQDLDTSINSEGGEKSRDILVNRGYVPKEFRDPRTRPESLVRLPFLLVALLNDNLCTLSRRKASLQP